VKRGGKPIPLGSFLGPALRRLGIADAIREQTGLRAWREAVGEPIARRTETLGVRGGVLWVAVEGSAWMQELSARRPEIVARLAERVGAGVIRDVRFVVKGSDLVRGFDGGSDGNDL
jgi:predicted nucleic acid-binding Zn ribbon protein